MGVILLVATVVVTLIVLPLAAVAWSRSKHLNRPAPPSWLDVLYAIGRHYRLTAGQVELVKQAVNGGRAAPAELRPATAEAAAAKVRWLESFVVSVRRPWQLALGVALLASTVLLITVLWRDTPVGVLLTIALTQLFLQTAWRFQLRRARQAVHRNAVPELPAPVRGASPQ